MIRVDIRAAACAVCDSCGRDGPCAIVGASFTTAQAAALINGHRTHPPTAGFVGPSGAWQCTSCRTPEARPL